MERLNYDFLEKNNYAGYLLKTAPERVMQFGEGNFLRAFVGYWFDMANEKAGWNGKCAVIKPRPTPSRTCDRINEQDGLYTLYLRGMENGEKINRKRIISSVSRCINPYTEEGYRSMMALAVSDDLELVVSNTTEAGIVYDPEAKLTDTPCLSYPGKLTQILYARFRAGKKGLILMPCELNDNNGNMLRDCINRHIADWDLGEDFSAYVNEQCLICNTLVDRIVPGAIRDPETVARLAEENGYQDEVVDVGEVFGVWNIEGPKGLADRLPFKKAGLNCIVVPDVTPYKKRKVRILNGAHTGFVLGSYLAGKNIVRDCMEDGTIRSFMNKMLKEEVIPTLPLDRDDCLNFAAAVQDRFNNPFVDHALMSISLNSTSKWKARNMPSFLDYVKQFGTLPACLTMSFAAYIAFYTSDIQDLTEEGLICRRPAGNTYTVSDDRWILEFYYAHRSDAPDDLVKAVMQNEQMWGQNLEEVPGFAAATVKNLNTIRTEGAEAAFASCL